MKARKQSVRIQTSLLNAAEHKLLLWLAGRLPAWVSSDLLTFTGFLGALLIATGYTLTVKDIHWLWLACFGLFVNWFGDSLDGTVARVRGTQRPLYGFFIDHTVDCINEAVMFIGVGLSTLMHFPIALMTLVAYLMMSIYVFINAHLKNEFKLTFARLGPTEFRVVMVIVSILFMYIAPLREASWTFDLPVAGPTTLHVLDLIAIAITVILVVMYVASIFLDARYYKKADPPKGPAE